MGGGGGGRGLPSRHERLKVRVGSISFLILMSASSTMGPQWLRSTSYSCMWGLSGLSGSCVGVHARQNISTRRLYSIMLS